MNAHDEARRASAPLVPPRWHDEALARGTDGRIDDSTGRRQGRIFALLTAMLALAGATVGLLSWLHPLPQPYFIPLWITEYESPRLPVRSQARSDWEALRAGRYFPRLSA